jgi:peptidoglycan/xylan/chitin deacetylase (PgdA/CDA1 family)
VSSWLKLAARQAAGEVIFRTPRPGRRGGRLAILMYHAVTAGDLRDGMQMSVSAAQFASHMASLRTLDADVVSLAEGVARLQQQTDRLAISVVFDDGFVGVHDYAAETLKANRIPATVFVTTDWVGRPAMPAADAALGRPMTWDEIRRLKETCDFTVGSHTATHPVLASLDAAHIQGELQHSREVIAGETGSQPHEFAYPFGTYGTFDARTRAGLEFAGYRIACTTVWGCNDRTSDPRELRRVRVSWCDSPREIRKSLAGSYDWYRTVQRLQARSRPQA